MAEIKKPSNPRLLRIIIFLFFCCYSCLILAQIPNNPIGSNPLQLKWHQINTDKFQLIYPDYLDSHAIKMANIIDFILGQNDPSIGKKILKLPILLNPQSVRSNAFVTVGPYRSEIVTMPPQFDCTNDWIESVTFHEFRHAQQFSNATQGVTHLVKKILGSWAWGGMMGLALPRWYYEGDAVFAETQYSFSGRGRLPAFHMEYKALALANKNYSYEKASAGSLKEYVPDWYKLGYYMSSYGRETYGPDIWKEVTADAARYKGIFYPFSRSLKKRTGLSTPELFAKAQSLTTEKWANESKTINQNPSQQINKIEKSTFTNYNNPIPLGNGQLLCEKYSFDKINSLHILSTDGSEKRVIEPGIRLDSPFSTLSYAKGQICYSRFNFHLRRSNVNYSNIYIHDLNSNKTRQISSKQHYFSPSLSHDATKIATVKIDEHMKASILILNAHSGQILREFPNPSGVMYVHPCWDEDDSHVIVISKANQKHGLISIDSETGKEEKLTIPSYHQISHPFIHGNHVYYSSTSTGTNNIFALNLNSKENFQLTSVHLGAFQPSISLDGKELFYAEYDSKGFNIKKSDLASLLWKPIYKGNISKIPDLYKAQEIQEIAIAFDSLEWKSYPIKKYNKWSAILNPHSLIPLIDHPVAGLQLLSDNTFSTLSGQAGVYYNYNENEWEYEAGLTYAELFPILHLNYVRSDRSALFYNYSSLTDTSLVQNIFIESWWENRMSTGITLPFNLSNGNMISNLRLQAFYRNISLKTEDRFLDPTYNQKDTFGLSQVNIPAFRPLFTDHLQKENFHSIDVNLVYQSIKRRARQNILPKWGYRFILRYRDLLSEENFSGSVFNANADLFLPVLFKNHGLLLSFAYQKEQLTDNYRFSDTYDYPRGYDFSLRRDEFIKLGVNYSFPLFYPDKAIGPLAFIKRVKANVFYDHGLLKVRAFPFQATNEYIRSTGIELTFDFRALRILEVDLGVRYSYALDPELTRNLKRHHVDFLLLKISE